MHTQTLPRNWIAFTSISLNDEEEDNDDDGPRQVVGLKWPLVSAGLNPATRRFPSWFCHNFHRHRHHYHPPVSAGIKPSNLTLISWSSWFWRRLWWLSASPQTSLSCVSDFVMTDMIVGKMFTQADFEPIINYPKSVTRDTFWDKTE